MKFKYVADCAAGGVVFKVNGVPFEMPKGVAVEVPEVLGVKLANNGHFEAVSDEAKKKPGRPKKDESDAPPTE